MGGQILPHKPFHQPRHIRLGDGQDEQDEARHNHVGHQAAVAHKGDEAKAADEGYERPPRKGEHEGDEDEAEDDDDEPAGKKRPFGQQLRRGQCAYQHQQATVHVWVYRGANGAFG